MRALAQLLKGNTDILILSLLEQEAMYGYQMIKELERRSQGFFRLGEGTLYPALHRLERSELVLGRWQRIPGGQERRYYSLTRKGQRWLEEQASAWARFASAVDLIVRPA
jgi:DNA-binding PadR family transcriptional regulator